MVRHVLYVVILAVCCAGTPLLVGAPVAAHAQEASPSAECPPTTEEENQAIVQRFFDAVTAGDMDVVAETLGPELLQDLAKLPDSQTAEEFIATLEVLRSAFPDIRWEIEHWILDGDYVAARGVVLGTHLGEFQGIAPTGIEFNMQTFPIFRIECGRIVEHWAQVDAIGRLQQLGAIPPSGGSAAGTPTSDASSAVAAGASPAAMDATPSGECPVTSEAENAALVQRWYDEVWTQANYDVIDDVMAPDHRHHRVLDRFSVGSDLREETVRSWHATFPDYEVDVKLVLTEGDLVVTAWTATGTHLGPWQDVEPTGNRITWSGHTLFRIECGKIAEEWSEANALDFFQQMGVVDWPPASFATPEPEAPA